MTQDRPVCFCYFGCEPSCGIGKSYIFTVLTRTVGIVCAVGVGSGCVCVCTYVHMYMSHGRRDCCRPAATSTIKVGSKTALGFLVSWGQEQGLGGRQAPLPGVQE